MVGMFVVLSLTCIESDEEQPMVFVTGETWIYAISNVLDWYCQILKYHYLFIILTTHV